jgi:ABC-type Fe3+-siderophore transport system permease subunit
MVMKIREQHMDNDWQDVTILLIGIWLFISPFVLQFVTSNPAAAITSFLIGVLITMFAMTGLSTHQLWEEWVNLVLGAFMIALPWVLGFSKPIVMWNVILAGALVGIFAIWAMIQRRMEYQHGDYPSRA